MNVLVTGGTGFVGREVVRQLRNSGHRAHLLVRNENAPAARELAAQLNARLIAGNVLDTESVRKLCGGMEAVIHLVGIIRETRVQTFENVHVRGTRNMVLAAQESGVRRFLQMSALGSRPEARSRYHQSKWAAEENVRRSGLGWTLFRPSIIYGPGDAFVNQFAKISRFSPVVPLIGNGQTRFQPIPVQSVAQAFVRALTEPGTVGETYDLCGGETLSLREIVEQILAVTGRRRLLMPLSFPLARLQAAGLEMLFGTLLGQAPPLNREQVLMLQEDNVGNGRPAEERFGLKHGTFREGIGRYLNR